MRALSIVLLIVILPTALGQKIEVNIDTRDGSERTPDFFDNAAGFFRSIWHTTTNMFPCETQAPGDGGNTNVPTASPVVTIEPTDGTPLEKATPYPTATPTKYPTATPTITPTTKTPTVAPTLGTPVYLGCWNEAPTRAMDHSAGSGWNIPTCIEYCRGAEFPFAGVQFFSQCVCSGNSYSKHGKALESDCNTQCTQGEGMCGGVWRIGVWTTGLPIPPSIGPTPVPTTATPTPIPTPWPTPLPTSHNPTPQPDPNGFNIVLGLQGINDDSVFQNAIDTWGQAITGDLPDFAASLGGSSSCGKWPTYVDDLYICGRYASIDGISGILGSAGPRHYRPSMGIPITGEMKFDAADVARLGDDKMLGIILHEMGHVLGIGPMWQINGLIDNFNVPCPYKTDSEASKVYQELSGCDGDAVPVEMSFRGKGSNCGHWKESCLGTEIMTPMASGTLPLSKITIAGLKDLGYTVNYDAAQNFTGFGCACGGSRLRRRLQNSTALDDSSTWNIYPPQKRRLSEEGLQRATEYGKLVMAENRQAMSLVGSGDAPDIGGEIIYILYEEDGVIHSVMVRE